MNILQTCIDKGYLIEKDLLNIFTNLNSIDIEISNDLLNILLSLSKEKILKKKILFENMNKLTILLLNLKEKKENKRESIDQVLDFLKSFVRES